MAENNDEQQKKKGVSKTGLLLGAAGLFLFIVGVKRTLGGEEVRPGGEAPQPESGEDAASDGER